MPEHDAGNRRRYPWRRNLLTALPLVILVVMIFAIFKSEDGIEDYCTAVREANPVFTEAVEFVSDFGNVPFYAFYIILLVTGIAKKLRSRANFCAGYLAGLGATLILIEILKTVVGRSRPPVEDDFIPFSFRNRYESFPSAHVTETLYTMLPLSWRYGRIGLCLLLGLWPCFMAVTRLYLGEHHPTDFLGSVVVALVGSWVAWTVKRRLAAFRPKWFAKKEAGSETTDPALLS